MNHEDQNHDDDLRDTFRQLREVDKGAVREFEAPREPRGSWHLRRRIVGAAVLATALLAGLLIFLQPMSDPGTTANPSDKIDVPFDEYSKLIEEEMNVASLSEWRSPTSFLLQPES